MLVTCRLLQYGSKSGYSKKDILLTVNGEALYQEEFDKIFAKYKEKGLTEAEILEGMVLELVTLEKADDFSVSVSEEDVQARYEELLALYESLFQGKGTGTDMEVIRFPGGASL